MVFYGFKHFKISGVVKWQAEYGGLRMIFILYILWFIFNGRFTAETAVVGLIVCCALYFFLCRFLGYSIKNDIASIKKIPLFIVFFVVLFFHIVLSNISVIKIILSPNKKPESKFVTFNPGLKKFTSKCILANSITLTPGTYTLKLEDGQYTVHALVPDFAKDLNNMPVLKYIRKMEDKAQ